MLLTSQDKLREAKPSPQYFDKLSTSPQSPIPNPQTSLKSIMFRNPPQELTFE
ncbi:hypothetical protein ACQFX9_22230 [Aliinostoc sp. HNIBRCY26]|uniref:hypothetical protein n=1 Tax=Aliinostoc sp. HNIBRCY26 TaxID=3418997 RepID=UPI003D068EAC